MNRPRLILTIFAACLAVVLAAMGWVSCTVVALDRRDAETQRKAEVQESARLALWRMDSVLGPIIAQEEARPYYQYRSFYAPPLVFDETNTIVVTERVLLPSPLLVQPTPFVRLHFQIDPLGRMSSPQAPEGSVPQAIEARLEDEGHLAAAIEGLGELAKKLDREALLAVVPQPDDDSASIPIAEEQESQAAMKYDAQQLLGELNSNVQVQQSEGPRDTSQTIQDIKQIGRARNQPAQQELRSNMEYRQRIASNLQNAYLSGLNRKLSNQDQQSAPPVEDAADSVASRQKLKANAEPFVREGVMKAHWVDGQLVLVRRVVIGDQTWLQGCWMDWDAVRVWLLQRVADLLPRADLKPATGTGLGLEQGAPHLLASLPVRLVPGFLNGSRDSLSPPIRTTLIVAWTCTLLAVAAVIVLVVGMAALSERRSAFVSAVTHELRTPLTTFRMYTQMLTEGMVTDEPRRSEYLVTLRNESSRLAQLVENVLSYARLERNRRVTSSEAVTLEEMLSRFGERLEQRAKQAGMQLNIDLDDEIRETALHTDVSAVEQIVFNLVDNACKYAGQAKDKQIEIRGELHSRRVRLTVTDYGPGVGRDVAGRLFRPFSKSARAAANSTQGVGLGLALSRRLARRLGGDLRLVHSGDKGSRFELNLPRG